ncbi:MAG: hypothetical protein ACRDD7_11855 [Peptostreptococcaceae bacterium]
MSFIKTNCLLVDTCVNADRHATCNTCINNKNRSVGNWYVRDDEKSKEKYDKLFTKALQNKSL